MLFRCGACAVVAAAWCWCWWCWKAWGAQRRANDHCMSVNAHPLLLCIMGSGWAGLRVLLHPPRPCCAQACHHTQYTGPAAGQWAINALPTSSGGFRVGWGGVGGVGGAHPGRMHRGSCGRQVLMLPLVAQSQTTQKARGSRRAKKKVPAALGVGMLGAVQAAAQRRSRSAARMCLVAVDALVGCLLC